MVYILLLIIVILLVIYFRLYHHYRRNVGKVTFMFDALENVDYAFHFPEDVRSRDDAMLNAALNRIKMIMEKYHTETTEREKYYELIIDSVDTGIMVVDSRGSVLQHNLAALKLLHLEALTHIVQIGDQMTQSRFSIHESYTVLKGKRVKIVSFSDINNELNNEELDAWIKLIRVLTHEIMNTITPVVSLSQTLVPKVPRGEVREGLSTISSAGRDLLHFVDNYRKFTHIPSPSPTLYYVKPFLERMARLCPHRVEVQVSPGDLIVQADESLIAHVITNLLKNAVEAGNKTTVITMHAYTDATEAVCIDVTNNGKMISDDVAQHVFIPFFTTKVTGSGIGLSLSKQIMRVSGGSLSLIRDKEHHLTTFRLLFP